MVVVRVTADGVLQVVCDDDADQPACLSVSIGLAVPSQELAQHDLTFANDEREVELVDPIQHVSGAIIWGARGQVGAGEPDERRSAGLVPFDRFDRRIDRLTRFASRTAHHPGRIPHRPGAEPRVQEPALVGVVLDTDEVQTGLLGELHHPYDLTVIIGPRRREQPEQRETGRGHRYPTDVRPWRTRAGPAASRSRD